ncbi:MAG: hypothetical protein KJZ84_25170, partial [Bryobacteraceae bacterium]|nr:hypothetical protein [Bryobacteraceae bacterium]
MQTMRSSKIPVLLLILWLLTGYQAVPQEAPRLELDSWKDQLESGTLTPDGYPAILKPRFQALQDLLRQRPYEVSRHLLSKPARDRILSLDPQLSTWLEEEGKWTGRLEVVFDEGTAESPPRMRRWLVHDDHRIEVHEADAALPQHCVMATSIEGVRLGDDLLAHSAAPESELMSSGCTTTGEQKTVVILVSMPSYPLPAAVTASSIADGFFGVSGLTVDGYFRDASYQRAWLTGTVVGPYALSQNYQCSPASTLVNAAIAAADPDVDFKSYRRVVVVAPRHSTSSCSIGIALVGCTTLQAPGDGSFAASWALLAADYATTRSGLVNLAAHEMGHNFLLLHSNSRDFGTVPLAAPGTAGTDREYWDVFSVMGISYSVSGQHIIGHMPPLQKSRMGWLAQGSEVLDVEQTGSFLLRPYSEAGSGLKALRIRRGTGGAERLWLEYRQPIGLYDSTLSLYSNKAYSGSLVRHETPANTSSATFLLHFDPAALPNDFRHAPLLDGSSWVDPHTDLTIQVLKEGDGLRVHANYALSPCQYALQPASAALQAGAGSYSFQLSTTAGCGYSAQTAAPWITLGTNQSGYGPATIGYSVVANSGTSSRQGTIQVAGLNFTITQAASSGQPGPILGPDFDGHSGADLFLYDSASGDAYTALSNGMG